jgi:hypothetical protein
VPEVFGEVTLDGRFGMCCSDLDGPTLWQLSRTGAVTFEQAGAIVALLPCLLHKTTPPPEVLSMRELYGDASCGSTTADSEAHRHRRSSR